MRHYVIARCIVATCWFVLVALPTQSAQAQTYNVIYAFTGGLDGDEPRAGVTLDRAGNVYGVANNGGSGGNGAVFKLSHRNQGWSFTLLHDFQGSDGSYPNGELVIAGNGVIYGVTEFGGAGDYGVIYSLRPAAAAPAGWNETLLYTFSGGEDGAFPSGPLTFDAAGNIYASAMLGGVSDNGVIAKFTPSGGSWLESALYGFGGGDDGGEPTGGIIFDQAGNIYGTTLYHPGDQVFQLAPSGNGWTKQTLHEFAGGSDGENPWGGLIFDTAGNLYGTTSEGGSYSAGTVFQLSPSNGGWNYSVIFSFQGPPNELCGPQGGLAIDAAGNLYGTTVCDGAYGYGAVFKLTYSDGGWTYTSLHDFTGGTDGAAPQARPILDTSGNLYGTASTGGGTVCGGIGCGVVWEITP